MTSIIAGAREGAAVTLSERHLTVPLTTGDARFHYVWLRDNCWCERCRVSQAGERRLWTGSIPPDLAPAEVRRDPDGTLHVTWDDGHESSYAEAWLDAHDYSRPAAPAAADEPVLWDSSLSAVPTFEHADVVGTRAGMLAYLDAMRRHGIARVRDTPRVPGEVERFGQTVGHLRETAFERVHNVCHDPMGYSVAHTTLELPPHTDMPSYHWPPSVQLLHFLVNEATGGESTFTDGWAVLADLRRDDPAAFATLARVPVRFQLFSADEDTQASAPMVQLEPDGRVRTLRFSNQLAQPLAAPFDEVEEFYRAYRVLASMVDGGRYTVQLRSTAGDLLSIHGHRVLHGRRAFDPASGARHLQDAYLELDDLLARRRVLLGSHLPVSAATGTR
ncbi:MAG: TauD/TfdA family dioxygenase [Nocardioidaceae bacterium]